MSSRSNGIAAAIVGKLEAAGIANARMNTMHEFLEHPQLLARNRWKTVESPAGTLRTLAPPFNMAGVDVSMRPVPAVGQHTAAILEELGFNAVEIAEWRRAGIV